MHARLCRRLGFAPFALLLGCTSPAPTPHPVLDSTAGAPAPGDVGSLCMDVGASARACWVEAGDGTRCRAGACAVPRPLPDGFPAHAWRCAGHGAARRCESRERQASTFRCDGARCVQERPRAPDAGEWLCTEIDSGVYCLGVIDAAGIDPGARDPAFVCGTRRGHAAPICVDFNPDQPPQQPSWRCSVRYESGAAKRVCEPPKGTPTPRLGSSCRSARECPRAALCADGLCLPPRPEPACWLDADCGDAAQCVWGSCRAKDGA